MERKLKIALLYRKPHRGQFSIERIFDSLLQQYSHYEDIIVEKVVLPKNGFGISSIIKNLWFVSTIKADVFHITGDINYLIFNLKFSKTLITVHDLGGIRFHPNWIKKALIGWINFRFPVKKAGTVVAVSTDTKENIHRYICKREVRVINNFVLFDAALKINSSKDFQFPLSKKKNILMVGTKENKNLKGLITAIIGLADKVRLIIIGVLSNKDILKLKSEKIEYLNYLNLTQEELATAYKLSDIVYTASTHEGFCLPIIEGNYFSIPVITSDLEPMKEVAGDAALLVNPYSISEIKNAIVRLITEQKTCESLVNAGNRNVRNYCCEDIASQYVNVYRKINEKA